MISHVDHLISLFDPAGCDILDVGAGNGSFARELARRGGHVIGLETDAQKVLNANEQDGDTVHMCEGFAESLPVGDETQDLICFIFSFHHVPLAVQGSAIDEAYRVLRSNGRLHVVDPRPVGTMTDVLKFVDDETEVRSRSQQRLERLNTRDGFQRLSKQVYTIERLYANFEDLARHVVLVDAERRKRLHDVEPAMRKAFARLGSHTGKGTTLLQPCVSYHFQKI